MIKFRYLAIFLVSITWTSQSAGQNNVTNLNWTKTYESEFTKITDFEQQGQNRSAYTKASEILDKAIAERSLPGIIGSFDPLIRNMYHVEDEALTTLLKKIASLQPGHPVVAVVVNSYLAELLTGYYERNRFRISQVAEGNQLSWEEVNKWSAAQMESAIDSLYSDSTEPEELKEISSDKLVSVMNYQANEIGWELRPRLYDLLQERILNYLQNNRLHWRSQVQNPDQALVDLLLKEDLTDYLENQDPDSRVYPIMKAFYNWEQSLLDADLTIGYIEVVLMRIGYINNFIGDKYMLQSIQLLDSLLKNYSSAPNRLILDHEIANVLYRKGNYIQALESLNTALEQKPVEAYPYTIARIGELKKSIQAPELFVQVEDAYSTDETPLVSIQFRNLDKVRLELYPIEEEEFVKWRFMNHRSEKTDFQFVLNKKSIWQKTIRLPETSDFKSHRTEAMIDGKTRNGTYAIRYWHKKDSLDLRGLILFQISDLALINTSDASVQKLYVLDRMTGERIKGAKVEGISFTRNTLFKNKETRLLREDTPGSFIPPDKYPNLYYKVTSENDTYISPMTYQRNIRDHSIQPFQRTTLLTDRVVYKPGQIIHFQALITLSRKLDSEIVRDQKIDVSLRNANGKEVWTRSFTSDEWGTVSGSIPIPTSGLKGNWSLQASPSGHASIQVEEYKRPNFELVVPDSSISRIDSMVWVSGTAKTYHGFPIQNGQGQVRVELQQRRWFYWGAPEESELIYTGNFQTDEDGDFSISWEGAEPPPSIHRYGSLYFYSVHLSVRAASGEIREITIEIPLDPNKKQVRIIFPEFQLLKDMPDVGFTVKNALGNSDSLPVTIQLDRLDSPDQYKVARYWELPDKPFLNQSQFLDKIEHIFYDHEPSMDRWAVDKTLKTWTLTIEDNDTLDVKDIVKQSGYYRILVTSIDGDTLTMHSFGLSETRKKKEIVHDAVEIVSSTTSAQPGETVELNFYTPKENRDGMIRIVYSDGTIQSYLLADRKPLKVQVEEKHRGGFFVQVYGYLANRFYNKSTFVDVPWENKELIIEGPQGLSELEVDQDTSLHISVLDSKRKGAYSEVSVAIYDASLDAYRPHDWVISPGFFLNFTNPLHISNIGGTLGDVIYTENNYWITRENIKPTIPPHLPFLHIGYRNRHYFGNMMRSSKVTGEMAVPSPQMEVADMATEEALVSSIAGQDQSAPSQPVNVRENFAETILFAGKVTTDSMGRVTIPFHTNDKAGRWKVLVFGHTQDLKTGILSHVFETTKEVFLESFLPGIVRQGDEMNLTFTLYNTGEVPITGHVQFEIRSLFGDENGESYKKNIVFDVVSGKSEVLSLPVQIKVDEDGPLIFSARVVDDAGRVWDATEEVLPVLPSSEVVFDGNVAVLEAGDNWSGKEITRLEENGIGEVTIRIVQNLYSELIKSIPYLQITSPVTTDHFFRNGLQALLGQFIAGEIPNFDRIYEEWKRKGELESRLAQNEDKKYVSLENSPWVRKSESGTEQMALLGLFFDETHVNRLVEMNLSKWAESQNSDGGFPWIQDGESSFFITVRFLAQWEKMKWAGVTSDHFTEEMLQKARQYVDGEFLRMWKEMKEKSTSSPIPYSRFTSYFTQRAYDFDREGQTEEYLSAWDELKDSVFANWSDQTSELRAKIGIAAWHLGDTKVSSAVVGAFVDNAIRHPELGIYWRFNNQTSQNGYLGILSGITELLILNDHSQLNDGIIQWVLVNKMTNDWQQNPHVTSLMLSLLKMSGDWTKISNTVLIGREGERMLSGLGDSDEIKLSLQELNSFQIRHIDGPPIWIGVITRREVQPEDLVEQSGDILHIDKTVSGMGSDGSIHQGEQMVIKLRISTDRDLDYVYIEDPLVPGMDPGISLSGFRWRLGLSYYQTFDHSTARFFIQHLPKGEYVLEYNLGVVRSGQFRHPRTKIQSYFVPEINGMDQWRPVVEIIN